MKTIVIVIAGAAALAAYLLWIRPWHMRWGATKAEVKRAMSGDDEIKNPMHVTTRAITIRARAAEIWPWLVQMGYQRGGMYSYDWIDRLLGILDRPSAERIIPEFQPGGFLMTRKHLLGIKRRAEAAAPIGQCC